MNSGIRIRFVAMPTLIATLFAAPAFSQDAEHDHTLGAAAPQTTAPKAKTTPPNSAAKSKGADSQTASGQGGMMDGQGGMMGGQGTRGGMMMDKKTMCDMHKQMMGKSDADRQAMMDEKMPGMSADKKQQQMHMMDEQCK